MPADWKLPLAWIPGLSTWIVIWSALAAATVALVALLRTRWREAKTWKKCALLSFWVHVLLGCLAANVRIGLGSAGSGSASDAGGPMRVAIVATPPQAAADVPEATPADSPLAEQEPVASAADSEFAAPASAPLAEASPAPEPTPAVETSLAAPPTPTIGPAAPRDDAIALSPRPAELALPTPDAALAAPDLLPEPEPAPTPEVATLVEAPSPAKAEPSAAQVPATQPDDDSAHVASTNAAPEGAAIDPRAAPRSGVPAAYANRFADRDALVAGGGGNPTTERAVRAALAWLAATQEKDGRWDPKRHGGGQERYVFGENRGAAGARADTGITALALLAFMGAGHTHRAGPYADNVARGLDFLRRAQGPNGNLGGDAEFFAHMYCHSMATFAISEACAMTGDAKLRPVVQRAVAYTLAAQHPTEGGWRYQAHPGADGGDTSQLGWQLMALRSAELAGVDIPPAAWSRVNHFLANVERGASGGLAAYRPEGPPSRAMTAEALFCRQLVTHRASGALSAAALDEARRALLEEPPGGVVINYYYWYYGTIALHRARHESPAAQAAWATWNNALTAALVSTQSGDGSWSNACLWGGYGGKVYTTSLAAMCLEVYYRYAPDEPAAAEPNVAEREPWSATAR
jgi:hypothetical protein